MGRAPCCDKDNVKKGPWSPEEDTKLKEYVEKHGIGGNWIALPHKAGLKRCGKSCRLRWLNYLRPNIKHGEFTHEEDRIICTLFTSIGSRWSIIAAQLPGRTDNDIKNYWNTKLKKKLMGISASQRKTHQPQNQLLLPSSFKNLTAPPPSLPTSNCYKPPKPIFTSLEGFPVSPHVISTITSPLFQGQMQQYQMKASGTPLMFGGEQSCSSSDGSCTQISYGKEVDYEFHGDGGERMDFENYLYGGVEESQMLQLGNNIEAPLMHRGSGLFVETAPYDSYEETKLLVNPNNGCTSLCLDDPSIGTLGTSFKTQGRDMYYN